MSGKRIMSVCDLDAWCSVHFPRGSGVIAQVEVRGLTAEQFKVASKGKDYKMANLKLVPELPDPRPDAQRYQGVVVQDHWSLTGLGVKYLYQRAIEADHHDG